MSEIISVVGVSKKFDKVAVLKNISFQLRKGELLALLGENGAGKTTLISMILGLLKPDQGSITILEHRPGSFQAKHRIGVMLQSASLPDKLTVIEQLRLFSAYYTHPLELEEVIASAKIGTFLEQPIGVLSGGQKQRLLFALALLGNPDALILDEPTVGLDAESRRVFWQCINDLKSQGKSIILTTHYLDEAEALADQVVLLHRGSVVLNDTTSSIKAQIKYREVQFVSEHTLDALITAIGEQSIQQQGKTFSVQTLVPETLITNLVKHKVPFNDLVVKPISLEDAVDRVSKLTLGVAV
ncbi:ABC transporter ATP-binding protein [Alteromonas sediminis]|uniref:ABC transporter ATP-binding protein n=1 Tax=Alteromonas sediminis TaxID=2259342 RepID=A0A3N5Y073_9ALTE|nr:ABC transporter ATP-binding protein [Alteromonas sediminis]RPJ66430.1 ABC transporter ATP-binding protein [Alteromonas sediminis]